MYCQVPLPGNTITMDVDEGEAEDVDVVAACADTKTHKRRITAMNSCERRLRIVLDSGELCDRL
jgi:hypothetical protein